MFYNSICLTGLFIICFLNAEAQDTTITRARAVNLAREHYEKGLSFHYQRHFEKAILEFEKTITLDPRDFLAYYFNGLSYEQLKDFENALQNYRLSLSLRPDFNEALFNRALVYYKTGNYQKAASDLEHLLTLPPGETEAIYFRGLKYGENDDNPGFNSIISMTRKNADVYNYLGLCYFQMNLYDRSAQYFAKAIEINPEDDNILTNAGLNYMSHGKIDSARILFERSLSINPYNSVAALNLSLCKSDSSAQQIRQLDQLIENNEEFPMAYAQRAYQHYLAGNYASAIEDYSSAIRLDPGNPEYFLERGMIYKKTDQVEKAINDFKSALNLDINNYQIWYNLGNIFFQINNYELSIDYYSEAIQLNQQLPEIYYNRSIAHYMMKDIDKACEDMKTAQYLGMKKADTFLMKYCR